MKLSLLFSLGHANLLLMSPVYLCILMIPVEAFPLNSRLVYPTACSMSSSRWRIDFLYSTCSPNHSAKLAPPVGPPSQVMATLLLVGAEAQTWGAILHSSFSHSLHLIHRQFCLYLQNMLEYRHISLPPLLQPWPMPPFPLAWIIEVAYDSSSDSFRL